MNYIIENQSKRFNEKRVMDKKATIKDVAKAAGVSISTVSYTISGNRPISAEVRNLIFEKIRKLDYRPNLFARSMRSRNTQRIGIVTDDFTNPQSTAMLRAISGKLKESSYEVIFSSAGLDIEKGRAELYSFSTGLVDGILNMLPQIDPGEAELLCGSVPVYTFVRDPYAVYSVDFDQVVRDSIDRFIALGHRKIGYLSPTFRVYQGKDSSVEVFAEHLKKRGLEFTPGQIVSEEDTLEGGEKGFAKLYERHPVTAVLTGNDLMALGVYRCAGRYGLSIPQDLSVIGCDDITLAELISPGLSTFRYPIQESAAFAVQMLLEKVAGKKTPHAPVITALSYIGRDSAASCKENHVLRKNNKTKNKRKETEK